MSRRRLNPGRRGVAVVIMTAVLTLGIGCAGAYAAGVGDLLSYESEFICTSCHEPLELVSSPQAQSEKAYLRSLIQKGLTSGQVKSAMVAQYGVGVLAKPPARGFDLVVYVLPPAVVAAALALLIFTLPKWRARSRRAAESSLPRATQLSSGDTERLDDELSRFI